MSLENKFELFEKIDISLKKAVKNAILQHKQAGQSIHILQVFECRVTILLCDIS